MRRIITGAIIALLLTITAGIGFYYYQRYRVILSDPFTAVPTNSALIFECKSGHDATAELERTGFWEHWAGNPGLLRLRTFLLFADSASNSHPAYQKAWTTKPLYLSLHLAGSSGAGWLAALNIPAGFSYKEVAAQVSAYFPKMEFNEREYEDVTIYESGPGAAQVCYAISKGILLLSESPVLVEDAIRQSRGGTPLRKVKIFTQVANATNKGPIRIFLNSIGLRDLLGSSWNPDRNDILELASRIGRWSALQVRVMENEVRLEGTCGSADPSDWVSAFRDSKPQRMGMASVLPERTAFLWWMGHERMGVLRDRLRNDPAAFVSGSQRAQLKEELLRAYGRDLVAEFDGMTGTELGLAITEPAGTDFSNNQLAIARALNPAGAERKLEEWSKLPGAGVRKESYRGNTLITFPDNRWSMLTLGNFSASWSQPALAFVKGYFIAAAQAATLKTLLDDLADGKRLDAKPGFSEHLRRVGLDQHLFCYASAARSRYLLDAFRNTDASRPAGTRLQDIFLAMSLRKDQLFAFQAAFTSGGAPEREPAVVWSTQLDTVIHAGPFLLPGDVAGKFYVAAQDKEGGFYLYNESGNLLWKVLVNDTLLGTIHTVDYYKDGNWQILFNTGSRLFLFDRDGRSVANYPIRLPARAAVGLSVYNRPTAVESNVLVPCTNGNVYNYRLNGSPDPDWSSDRPAGIFTQPLQAATLDGRIRFLSITDDRKLRALDARGKASVLYNGTNTGTIRTWDTRSGGTRIVLQETGGRLGIIGPDGTVTYPLDSGTVTACCILKDTAQSSLLAIRNDSVHVYTQDFEKAFSMHVPDRAIEPHAVAHSRRYLICAPALNKSWMYLEQDLFSKGYPVNGSPGAGAEDVLLQAGDKLVLTDRDRLVYLYTLE